MDIVKTASEFLAIAVMSSDSFQVCHLFYIFGDYLELLVDNLGFLSAWQYGHCG